jgi:hypothetical protein
MLLPDDLAAAALAPPSSGPGVRGGPGRLLSPHGDLAFHSGAGAGFTAVLRLRPAGRVTVPGVLLGPVVRGWV